MDIATLLRMAKQEEGQGYQPRSGLGRALGGMVQADRSQQAASDRGMARQQALREIQEWERNQQLRDLERQYKTAQMEQGMEFMKENLSPAEKRALEKEQAELEAQRQLEYAATQGGWAGPGADYKMTAEQKMSEAERDRQAELERARIGAKAAGARADSNRFATYDFEGKTVRKLAEQLLPDFNLRKGLPDWGGGASDDVASDWLNSKFNNMRSDHVQVILSTPELLAPMLSEAYKFAGAASEQNRPSAVATERAGGEEWIQRAMESNPGMSREEIIKEGIKAGKLTKGYK